MKTHVLVTTCLLLSIASSTRPASGAEAQGAASGQAQAGLAAGGGAATASAAAEADAAAEAEATRKSIRERAEKVSMQARARAEAQLRAEAEKLERAARAEAGGQVAARLAKELGVEASVLAAERSELQMGWGELMIGHTLAASAGAVTAADLFALRAEGMGWGSIAAGLGLSLGDAVRAVKAEGQVARGVGRADGRVQTIRREGIDARAGVDASSHARVGVGSVGASATSATRAGAGVSLPPVRVKP